jgi:pimeloyl-ACP methyl ester carboxylesterase
MFDDQVNFLKSNYRCVLFDFRGQGKSQVTTEGYELDNLTKDIHDLIISLNCNPCHFIGFSMGGMVAMRLAIRYPDLLKSLILIDTSSEPEPSGGRLRNIMMLWVAKNIGLKPLANKVISMFFGPSFLIDPNRKDLRILWKNHFLSNDRTGLVRAVKGVLYRNEITSVLHKINVPTRILWGDKDSLTDKQKADIMLRNINNSVLDIIPRAGHMSPVEEPGMVNELILDFLNKT